MFNIGDRVEIENTGELIKEVRGELGYVMGIDNSQFLIQLDNGAAPSHPYNISVPFYSFLERHIRLVAATDPEWEI